MNGSHTESFTGSDSGRKRGKYTRINSQEGKKYHMVSNHTTFHSKALMSDDTKRKIKTINGQTLASLWRAMGLETERACDRSIL